MNSGLSDQVRTMARARYVQPALQSGKTQFSIRVRDLLSDLRAEGFPARHTPQICSALQTSKFLRENGLEIEFVEGPPKKMSPTVIFGYRVLNPDARPGVTKNPSENRRLEPGEETPEEWAHRMTGKLFGLMKEEFAAFGGGEAFLRWVRSDDEVDAE